MSIRVIHLSEENCLTEEQTESLKATLLCDKSYNILLREDADVYKPDGSLLVKFRKKVIPLSYCKLARKTFEKAAIFTENRGVAAGMDSSGMLRKPKKKKDGTMSKQTRAKPVQSGVVGFFEEQGGRFPYCRMTAFNLKYGDEFAAALPFVQTVSALFKEHVPDRWQAQAEIYNRTCPDYRIPDTVFTTMTVNKNWQTAVHKDAGDLREGFGVLTAVRSPDIQGCYFCLPRYRVAVDMDTQDIMFADVHEWHGNTPLLKLTDKSYRLSFVCYYRQNIEHCEPPSEQLKHIKSSRGIPKL